MIIFSM